MKLTPRHAVGVFTLSFCFTLLLGADFARASCESHLIEKPVGGLYESIPDETILKFGDLQLLVIQAIGLTQPWTTGLTSLLGPESDSFLATADRKFSADRTKMKLSSLRTRTQTAPARNAPAFLRDTGAIDLVRGRGIPTSVFLTLHQMRVAGVGYGGLREVSTSEITNQVTAFELRHRPLIADWIINHPDRALPANLIADEILNTSTGRYIRTTLTQAGLRITAVVVQGGDLKPIRDLDARQGPEILKARRELGPQVVVPIKFTISLEVAPY